MCVKVWIFFIQQNGRNTLTFFDVKMQEAITARVNLERELRQTLKEDQFWLVYQVQVDHLSQPISAEALIRCHVGQ